VPVSRLRRWNTSLISVACPATAPRERPVGPAFDRAVTLQHSRPRRIQRPLHQAARRRSGEEGRSARTGASRDLADRTGTQADCNDAQTLNSHVNARFPTNGPLAPPSTASSPPTDTTAKSLETALLLIAKNASAPDAWTPTKAGAEGGDGESESKTGRKTGVKGKRKAKEDEGGVEGAGTSQKKVSCRGRSARRSLFADHRRLPEAQHRQVSPC
jgi:hypothetical protein